MCRFEHRFAQGVAQGVEWIRTAILGGLFVWAFLIPAYPAWARSQSANTVDISIFHTNDLHSRMHAVSSQPLGLGGLARLATLLKRLRGNPAKAHSLTVDAGDWSEGSWYFSIDAGSNMLRIMDAMGYDAVALGDHDYLTGPDQVARTIREARPSYPVLAANLHWPKSSASDGTTSHPMSDVVHPYVIKEIAGLRVGIIGLTHSTFMFESYLKPVEGDSAVKTAAKLVRKVRKKADIVIVLSHNEHLKNTTIAKFVPGIDLLVSGHSHEKLPSPRWVRNVLNGRTVPVVETGEWGQFLGELKLRFDRKTRKVEYPSYKLHAVASSLAEDPSVRKLVQAEDEKLASKFGAVHDVVAYSNFQIRNDHAMRGGLATLASRAYRRSTGAELSLEEVSLTGADLPEGPITALALHDVLPHLYSPASGKEWTVRLWNARGRDLKVIFQVFFTTFGLMPESMKPGWLGSDNVTFDWNPGALKSVRNIFIGGRPIESERRYEVALTEGLLFSFGIANHKLKLKLDLSDSVDTGIEAWRSITEYAVQEGKLTPESLCIGCDYRVTSSDIAVPYFGIREYGGEIRVRAVNFGSKSARSGRLKCESGIADGFAEFGTDLQQWTPIGESEIPALKPDEAVEIKLPWHKANDYKRFVPVRCMAEVPDDGYTQNNSGLNVFRRSLNPTI